MFCLWFSYDIVRSLRSIHEAYNCWFLEDSRQSLLVDQTFHDFNKMATGQLFPKGLVGIRDFRATLCRQRESGTEPKFRISFNFTKRTHLVTYVRKFLANWNSFLSKCANRTVFNVTPVACRN